MPTDSNHHSRNLTVFSFFFILYWLLGLEPTDDNIRLTFVNFTIHNTTALPYLTHGVLFYFAWRFYLNSKKKVSKSFATYFNSVSSQTRNKYPHDKLKSIADLDFETNHKGEFIETLKPYLKSEFQDFEVNFHISELKLSPTDKGLELSTTYHYSAERSKFNHFSSDQNLHIKNFKKIIEKRLYLHLLIWRFIKFSFSTEDSPNFFLPWVLFILAITTSILSYFSIDFV